MFECFMGKGLRERREQRKRQMEFFGHFFSPGDLCFDVGANMGDRAELFMQMGARVVAVEPQQICIDRLRKRFSRKKDVFIEPCGLADYEGQAEMAQCEDITVLSTMSDKWQKESRFASNERVSWKKKVKVPVTTLDQLISKYGVPKFCKIDVEGFEYEVLKGLSSKLSCVSFEFMREFLDDAERILDLLQQLGDLEVSYSLGENYSLSELAKCWGTAEDALGALRRLEDPKLWGDIYVKIK